MKDIGIYYKSTCCGMFILYYILGSDQKFNVTARNKELDFGTNKKLMTAMFYKQFQKQMKAYRALIDSLRPVFLSQSKL